MTNHHNGSAQKSQNRISTPNSGKLEGFFSLFSSTAMASCIMPQGQRRLFQKLLNFEKKQHSMDIAQEILATVNDDPNLLKKFITGEESPE